MIQIHPVQLILPCHVYHQILVQLYAAIKIGGLIIGYSLPGENERREVDFSVLIATLFAVSYHLGKRPRCFSDVDKFSLLLNLGLHARIFT